MNNIHPKIQAGNEGFNLPRIRTLALRMEPEDQQQLLNLTRKTWSDDGDTVLDTRYSGKPENAHHNAAVAEYTLPPLDATHEEKRLSSDKQQSINNWARFFGTITCHETALRYYAPAKTEAPPSIIALSRITPQDHQKFMSLMAIQGVVSRIISQKGELYIVSRIANIAKSRSGRIKPPEAQSAIIPVHFTRPTILS